MHPQGETAGEVALSGGLRAAAALVRGGDADNNVSGAPAHASAAGYELPDPEEERTQETLVAARHALWQHSFHRIQHWLLSSEVRNRACVGGGAPHALVCATLAVYHLGDASLDHTTGHRHRKALRAERRSLIRTSNRYFRAVDCVGVTVEWRISSTLKSSYSWLRADHRPPRSPQVEWLSCTVSSHGALGGQVITLDAQLNRSAAGELGDLPAGV